jgi:HAD superfamily hydrolase (TIGR01662 family)
MLHLTRLTPKEFKDKYFLLICDADGTLRRCTVPGQPCPNKNSEWEVIEEARDWLSQIDFVTEYYFAIASNQGGVSLGLISEVDAMQMLIDLAIKLVGKSALDFLGVTDNLELDTNIKICTSLDKTDYDRKPNPGMLEKVMYNYGIKPHRTLMVGDMESDRLAAENVGCDFIWAWDLFGFEKEN